MKPAAEQIRAEIAGHGAISFARFMELAMYHPTAGYYTRDFKRVGRDEKADFFTSTTFSPVWKTRGVGS